MADKTVFSTGVLGKIAAAFQLGVKPALFPQPPGVGFSLSEEELAAATALMQKHPVIDAHAHPGRTFLRGARHTSFVIKLYTLLGGCYEDRTLADMQAGGMDAALFNGVADIQLLTLGSGTLKARRGYRKGEAWQSYQTQLGQLKALATAGKVRLCLQSADVLAAKAAGHRGAVLAMEGADFLEQDLSRVQQVYDDGMRMLTLVHYTDNTLGGVMAGASGEGGLTSFGAEVVAAMNEAGLMVDLSHASEKTTLAALALTKKPAVITHTHINSEACTNARFVSEEVAHAVAETGGYIGAWPAGIGMSTLGEFVDRIDFLVETVGEDHVALGSDMDANYKPVMETYRKMPLVVGALLKRGYSAERVAKFMGGNILKVMDAVQNT
jgi:membrane dipeptidase